VREARPDAGAGRRFSTGAGFSLARDVFRERPLSFLRLAAIQIVVFALAGVGQFWLLGVFGQGVVDAQGDPAALARASALISVFSLLGSAVFIVLWAWVEGLWLGLFVEGRAAFRPSMGGFFRILAAFLIIYALVFVAAIALSVFGTLAAIPILMAASTEPEPIILILVISACILVPLLLFAFLVLIRFSALPALAALKGGMPMGQAWQGAGRRLGALMAAWLTWSLIYLLVLGVAGVVLAFGPGPYLDAMTAAFTNLDDPAAQYRVYAAFARSPGEIAAFTITVAITNTIFVPVLALARGIGVALALDDEAAAKPA